MRIELGFNWHFCLLQVNSKLNLKSIRNVEEEVTVEQPKPQEKRMSAKKWQWEILDEE